MANNHAISWSQILDLDFIAAILLHNREDSKVSQDEFEQVWRHHHNRGVCIAIQSDSSSDSQAA